MRVDWCVSSWFRIKNTHSLTHEILRSAPYTVLVWDLRRYPPLLFGQREHDVCTAVRSFW